MGLIHILAKNGTFICRFNDGEFGSKWCGIWKEGTKYFDYFAFAADDEWLSSSNIQSFKYINSMLSIQNVEGKDRRKSILHHQWCCSANNSFI